MTTKKKQSEPRTKPAELRVEYVPLSEIQSWPGNPKAHDDEGIQASIERFGFNDPLTVDETSGRLVEGHGRVHALLALQAAGAPPPKQLRVRGKEWLVPVVRGVGFDNEAQAQAYLLAHNRLVERGGWDSAALAAMITEVRSASVEVIGWSDEELKQLLATPAIELPVEKDEIPTVPKRAITQVGDVWLLGGHRLLCGSATSATDVATLMRDDRLDLVFTDPPYGVDYVGKTADALVVHNDGADGLPTLLKDAFDQLLARTRPGASWYVCAPSGPNMLVFAQLLTDLEIWRQSIAWVKDVLVMGHSDFHYQHEQIFYGWAPGSAHRAMADRKQTTVWNFDRPKASRLHPTMKPVALVEHAIKLSSAPSDLVGDTFGGSGTTLIAATQADRRCVTMELSPNYCDVIVERWQNLTGKKATRA